MVECTIIQYAMSLTSRHGMAFSLRQGDFQYYGYIAQLPLLLQEAETCEKWVEEWEQASKKEQ